MDPKKWLDYSKGDYEDAMLLYDNERYRNAAYLLQQSCEKYFKYLSLTKDPPEKLDGHDLTKLFRRLPFPELNKDESFVADLSKLSYFITLARYPSENIDYNFFMEVRECADRVLTKLEAFTGNKAFVRDMKLFDNLDTN